MNGKKGTMQMKITGLLLFFVLLPGAVCFSQGDELDLEVFRIQYSNAAELYEAVKDLKSERGKITSDANSNTIIVIDYPSNIERVAEVLKNIDIRPVQVKIEVIVAEMTAELLDRAGIRSFEAVIPAEGYGAIIELVRGSRGSDIRTDMTIRTMNNSPAVIQAVQDEIYGGITVTHTHDGEVNEYNYPLLAETGSFLEVLPRVNGDGTITVTVRPRTGRLDSDGELKRNTALTRVSVNNGDTIALGGVNVNESGTGGLSEKTARTVMFLTATVDE